METKIAEKEDPDFSFDYSAGRKSPICEPELDHNGRKRFLQHVEAELVIVA